MLIESATGVARVEDILGDLLPKTNINYFRFSPEREEFANELDETREEKVPTLHAPPPPPTFSPLC